MGLHHMVFRRGIDRVPCGLRLKASHRRLKTFLLLRLVNIASLGERLKTWCLLLLGSTEGRWLDLETAACLLELITRMLLGIIEAAAILKRLRLCFRNSLPAITEIDRVNKLIKSEKPHLFLSSAQNHLQKQQQQQKAMRAPPIPKPICKSWTPAGSCPILGTRNKSPLLFLFTPDAFLKKVHSFNAYFPCSYSDRH